MRLEFQLTDLLVGRNVNVFNCFFTVDEKIFYWDIRGLHCMTRIFHNIYTSQTFLFISWGDELSSVNSVPLTFLND